MIVDVKIFILDNLIINAMFSTRGYQDGDPLRCVYMLPGGFRAERFPTLKAGMIDIADTLFEQFNQDDRPNGKYSKSLSIGDVVQIHYGDGVMSLACDPLGWREVYGLPTEWELDNTVPDTSGWPYIAVGA